MSHPVLVASIIDKLVQTGEILPEHRGEMIEVLDHEVRRAARKKLQTIADLAVDQVLVNHGKLPLDGQVN